MLCYAPQPFVLMVVSVRIFFAVARTQCMQYNCLSSF